VTLCSVTGAVVATVKHPSMNGRKLLVCRPIDPRTGAVGGSELIAIDSVQAGPGDRVLVCDEGNAARLVLGDSTAPIRTMIVAIVDQYETRAEKKR
jgi:microcompartment protein CcmK/EutM